MIRITLAFMLISGSAIAQIPVQGTIAQDAPSYTNIGTIQPLEGIPLEQTQMAWGICGITPSGKCVHIKVDEGGRVIVSPDEKSDAYTAGYQKGYTMGFKNGSETK